MSDVRTPKPQRRPGNEPTTPCAGWSNFPNPVASSRSFRICPIARSSSGPTGSSTESRVRPCGSSQRGTARNCRRSHEHRSSSLVSETFMVRVCHGQHLISSSRSGLTRGLAAVISIIRESQDLGAGLFDTDFDSDRQGDTPPTAFVPHVLHERRVARAVARPHCCEVAFVDAIAEEQASVVENCATSSRA